MSIDCTILQPSYKQRFFASAIVRCRRTRKSGKLRRSRERSKLADALFIVTITLSLTSYVSSATATKCVAEIGGRFCCVERNTIACDECTGLENCFPTALFASGRSDISAKDRGRLAKAAAEIKQLPPDTIIEIVGHTDNSGGRAANVELSRKRADAVRSLLVGLGVRPEMLTAKGSGEAGSRSASFSVIDQR